MADKLVSKVIIDGEVKLDISTDTVESDKLLRGITAHNKAGEQIIGSCDFDSDTTDANATASEILLGQTAYVNKNKVTGTMPNNGAVEGVISTKEEEYNVTIGFHDGSGTVKIADTEQAKLVPNNIRQGVTVLGVEGSMDPQSEVTSQSKNATPNFNTQNILPDEDVDYLSEVIIAPIPVTETPNAAGGLTLTVG